jgi:hypothetical protein
MILQTLFPTKVDLIIRGDININYLNDSDRVGQLKALLNSYNLFSTVTFHTGIGKDYISAIDNSFIDSPKFKNYKIFPLNNGLSDHDVHLIMNILLDQLQNHQTYFKRKMKHGISF